ncbi:Uncharacterised protein [Citrobacter amalonaticus]|nr:Uncharacterised protein [Citrobacter amalonaticus]
MSEPIKPRIDFAGPLDVEQSPAFKAQQTFSETQAQSFAPATVDEPLEEEGQAEAVIDAALRPKRSLWRKMVMGGPGAVRRKRGGTRCSVDNERLANPGLGGARRLRGRGADYWGGSRIGGNRMATSVAFASACSRAR